MDKMILVDLEPQNFPVESGIYEVACLAIDNYQIVDQLYLAKEIPGYDGDRTYGFGYYDISQNATEISKFKAFLTKNPYPIVAHNCPFDKKFLTHYKWIPEDYETHCSMRAIRIEDNSHGSYALKNLVKHYGVSDKVKHTAFSDVMQVYEILRIVKPQTWLPVGVHSKKTYQKSIPKSLESINLNVTSTDILDGEVICFTGKSSYPRSVMEELAIKNGGSVSNTITKKTTMLVVGIEAGSKLDKAQEKEISIISDEDFMKILNMKLTSESSVQYVLK